MPSPLAGEGGSAIAQQDRVRARAATPHPIEHVATPAVPSPARGEGKLANADCGHRPTPRRIVTFLTTATAITSAHKNKPHGGNDGRRSGSSSLAFSRPAWAGRVPDQAHHLV